MEQKRTDARSRFLRRFSTFCFVWSAIALVLAWRLHLWSLLFSGVGTACAGLSAFVVLRQESRR